MAVGRIGRLIVLLLGVDLLDELSSGVPSVGAPDIQTAFGLSYTTLSIVLFTVPLACATLIEPPIFVLSDRLPRKRFVVGGLATLAGCAFAAALAPTWWVLAIALAVWFPASGAGVSLSQATLMDARPDERERMMTRWVFLGTLGDLATPALFGLLAAFALGWRHAFGVVGVLIGAYAAVLAFQRFPEHPTAREEVEPRLLDAVRAALRNRGLLLWLCAGWLCGLLDETLVAFGSLHLRDNLGADVGDRSVVLTAMMAGGVLGLLATDRLLARFDPIRLLALASAVATVLYLFWIFAVTSIAASAIVLFGLGMVATPFYPIAKAQAYRALPGQSGMVNAVRHVFAPLDVALPFVLGMLADAFGLVAALLVLAAQPVGVLLIAAGSLRRARDTPGGPRGGL